MGNAEEIQSANNRPINSQEFLGYDAAANKLVRSVVVGNGNSYRMTASDWSDNKLVWTGSMVRQGSSFPLRQEITQDSQDRFTATYFVLDDNDNWIPVVDETCVLQE